MKTPDDIKKGLEYISATNIARKVAIAKAGRMPYEYAEEAAADALAYIRQLEAELEQVKAERDRYWQYIKSLGCDTCGGDCDRCEVGLDRVWSGWVWAGEKEEKRP